VTLETYLGGEETTRPRELAYGLLREPPAPGFGHQILVGRIYRRIERHVRRSQAGQVVMSPIDVILDARRVLVVQPDLVFVSTERLAICKEQIWGAPDLVVEVLSMGTRRRDRTIKVGWFREYGVRECWLVDPSARHVEVIDLGGAANTPRVFEDRQTISSIVLPRLRLRPADVFDH
jgi:Uma2 family endonuclease